MSVRSLTSTGDWTFGNGGQSYLRGLDEIRQNLFTRANMWRGDCFFAPLEGVDYNNYLEIGTMELLDADIRRVILQTSGVLRIISFESSNINRAYTATVSVITIFGEIEVTI